MRLDQSGSWARPVLWTEISHKKWSESWGAVNPYGKLVAASGSVSNPLQFAGQYTDAESGLQYLRARYYDPVTAQFISRDPSIQVTRAPYLYGGDTPLNRSDPSGLWFGIKDSHGKMSDFWDGGTDWCNTATWGASFHGACSIALNEIENSADYAKAADKLSNACGLAALAVPPPADAIPAACAAAAEAMAFQFALIDSGSSMKGGDEWKRAIVSDLIDAALARVSKRADAAFEGGSLAWSVAKDLPRGCGPSTGPIPRPQPGPHS